MDMIRRLVPQIITDKDATQLETPSAATDDGPLLRGVKFNAELIETETVIYRSVTGTVRRIQAEHREMGKFRLD